MNNRNLSIVTGSVLTMALYPATVLSADYAIEEVVVTATKRAQSLNDVGLAISAMSADDLQNRRVANVADLALEVPGLNYAPSPAATPVYTLRGVGFFESSLGAYPDVSLYIDQAPLPFPAMAALTAFDLERVEVLKGPQGTLFGNNATGGAINFIAAKPTDEFSAGIGLTYGRFNTTEVSGHVSGPLSDTVKARLALKTVKSDEWQRAYDSNEELGEQDNTAIRLIVDWQATEDLMFSLNLNAWENKDDPTAVQKIAITPQNGPGEAGFGGVIPANLPILNYPNVDIGSGRDAGWTPGLPYQDHSFEQVTLRADYDISDALTLTSLTAFGQLDFEAGTDGDGTALVALDLPTDVGDIETFSQEFRLANDPAEAFRWMLGLNVEQSSVDQATSLAYKDTTSFAINGINVSYYTSEQEMDNLAAFANVEFDVSDKVTLKGGVRQTKAEREGVAFNGDDPVIGSLPGGFTLTEFFNLIYGAVYGGAVPAVVPGESIVLDTRTDAAGNPLNPASYLTTGNPSSELDEESTSWSVGVDFRATEDLLLYANIMKGYKAGSFPHLSGAIYKAYEPVTQESLIDYEVGFKAQLADGRLSVNGAAFYYDYEDKQLRAKFVDPIFGALDLLTNVPESEITGAELEIIARPLAGLNLSASVTYLDAEVTKYEGVVGSTVLPSGLREAVTASFDGVDLPYAPQWSFSVRGDYDFTISEGLDGFIGVGVTGQSESIGILTVSEADRDLYEIRDYTLVNANVGIRSADGDWQLMAWGKNITDEYYWSNTIQAYDTVGRYPGKPAEYGVTFNYNF